MLYNFKNKRAQKALARTLELFAFTIAVYLVIAPFYLNLWYAARFFWQPVSESEYQNLAAVQKQTEFIQKRDDKESEGERNRLIITKINVDAPIVEGKDERALSRGAWRLPQSATPDKIGNTVITGHRFQYLPPHNTTFYLFHKLAAGDIAAVVWQGNTYYYRITQIKIVPSTAIEILAPTTDATLTLFTCDPIWSTTNRLVVIAKAIRK